ncbi:LysR family transcriptional regulator [Sulfidibacter corallicola]|uniref:LysR family transcriptional regulator n=1 Tax=Sulfidibacter corallicola TaxID=2818388 RepID=A0A8A4TQI3_SULCO|nr:LysR family transcriptional regulator [Sulfidibacter corallicola]QTD51258.1 LysR family transcriptional regulator [Sulfidibacter corallicola]
MTLDQLIVLETIVRTGSFRAASEALFRTQPAISAAVRKLEEELNLKLFSRDGYRPVLTEAGRAILEKAQSVLRQARGLEDLAANLAQGCEPELRIAVNSICPMPIILDFLRRFDESHPATRLRIGFEVMGGTIERLLDGEVDLALLALPRGIGTSLTKIPLGNVTMLSVAAPNFAAFRLDREPTLEDMRGFVQVVVRDTTRHMPKIDTGGMLEGGRHWSVGDPWIKKEIILAGLGWGALPDHMIEAELKSGTLLPLTGSFTHQVELPIYLARLTERPPGRVASELWHEMAREFSDR